eukprot:gene16578-34532_t
MVDLREAAHNAHQCRTANDFSARCKYGVNMDRWTEMELFVHVAESGSLSRAAELMNMSNASASRQLAALEERLGVRLLQRTTRSVTLTDAGEHALRRCQQMLALSQDLEEETATTTEGALRGQLRLTCSVSFAFAQMGAAIADFLAQHPQLKIDLDASEGSLNLVEKRIDLAIRISAEPDPLLIGRPLARCDSALVASPAYLATHGVPQQPADLAQHRCLSYANFGKSVWQLTRGEVVELNGDCFGDAVNSAARLADLERVVAIKEYLPTSLSTRQQDGTVVPLSERHRETFDLGMRSFINEARLLAQFDHPSLLKVYRFWQEKGTTYMVMPFYKGDTLREALVAIPAGVDEAWLIRIMDGVTQALAVMHN